MGLVDYSESEGSDNEAAPPAESTPKPRAAGKPAFDKMVASSHSNKIKVSLPSPNTAVDDASTEEPPTKRVRTGGGFAALLSAPKNTSSLNNKPTAPSGRSLLAQTNGRGLSGRINLKTSATPAFSREVQEEPEYDEYGSAVTQPDATTVLTTEAEQLSAGREDTTEVNDDNKAEVKQAAKPMMFKPLSVSRNPMKKKPPAGKEVNGRINGTKEARRAAGEGAEPEQHRSRQKPKVSLFGASVKESAPETERTNTEYVPLLEDEDDEVGEDSGGRAEASKNFDPAIDHRNEQDAPAASANDLNALANTLRLSAAERRQLFGRGGQPTNAQVAQFNLAQEYKHNQEMRENEELTPSHNPVKSIAPGKHSLQQLVNAAQTNREALDESFARGKSNKKAAGAKYGW